MSNNNDSLLESVVPHLKEHLSHLKAQKDEIDGKIKEVERTLSEIGHGEAISKSGRRRKPKGANKVLLQEWFTDHPATSVGQAEVASKTGITPSSARSALDRLTEEGFLGRENSLWRLKQKAKSDIDRSKSLLGDP